MEKILEHYKHISLNIEEHLNLNYFLNIINILVINICPFSNYFLIKK